MIRFLCSLLFLGIAFCSYSQSYPDLSEWSQTELDKANTAKDLQYLSEEERLVIFYMNLSRINPPLFSKTILTQYLKENEVTTTSYVTTLHSDLKKTKPMAALHVDSNLFVLAKQYAISHGAKGQFGHIGFAQRMREYNPSAENCSYGYEAAIDIVLTLLIDQGVSGVGHRKNILDPIYTITGASIQYHSKYETCCVIDFASKREIKPTNVSSSKKKKKKKR